MTRGAGRPGTAPQRAGRKGARRGPPFELDRVFALRAALAVVLALFLFLILKVSMIAFGGSSAREAKRIENAIDPSVRREAQHDPAVTPEAAPAR